jgi:hypothetical protein
VTVWCRVRDLSTGHHYDIPLSRLDLLVERGAVVELLGRRRVARTPRRPKHFVDLSGRRTTPATRPADLEEQP